MATVKKAAASSKSDRQLRLNRETVKDLTIDAAHGRKIKGGMLPPTQGCPKLRRSNRTAPARPAAGDVTAVRRPSLAGLI